MLYSVASQVIVFDENSVVETKAVVVSSSTADSIFFETPPSRCCFSCIVDTSIATRDRLHELFCKRRDAAEAANDIEDCAFAGKQISGITMEY